MKIEKFEIFHLQIYKYELDKLIFLLEQINSGMSQMPDWTKEQAKEWVEKLEGKK